MPEGAYKEKALAAIKKNFRPVKLGATRVKSKFADFCKNAGLTTLAKNIKNRKGSNLNVFFSAKRRKPDVPFRTIVSEGGSWQVNVSRFLQSKLKNLVVNDPFHAKGSTVAPASSFPKIPIWPDTAV
ncbi:hypothetical protein HPB51_029184 [Rhipicephalus microplus]|uniref:Tick transposon n=1 Tax=Rhipicephalus microplus TaxID=6941 RepID=A0A9J6CV93_RHIMP|nr:hypothetical protein HPB51_029184 [Rhipicephalus microplus]